METKDGRSARALVRTAQELAFPGADFDEIDQVASGLKPLDCSVVPGLKPLDVEILANITTDYLADFVRLMLVRVGFAATVTPSHYGRLISDLLSDTHLAALPSRSAIVILTHRDLQFPPPIGTGVDDAQALVTREIDFWSSVLARSKVPTVVVSFDLPTRRVLDETDGLAPGGLGWHVRMTNLGLAARLPTHATLVDAEALQYRVGARHWHDERLYHLCKQPFSMEALPEIAHTVVAAMAGLHGAGRKVLVLDLDNTLWGGVIGDDGLQGIELGSETAEGEAFVSFQSYVKRLSERGIVLAVCSKNRDAAARSPFREHTGMILRESDIACFVANFDDKASNIRHIARSLNVGLDSLVFVDDSPVERALVRSELPEVLVVELPSEPAHYAQALEGCKAFPLRHLTREDLGRAASYRAVTAVREAGSASGTDMEQFLKGLEPKAGIESVNAGTADRIVQLLLKTNQFKLNLRTFQIADILAAADDVIALRLTDRLQDYGIVAIAVTTPTDGVLHIDNWVMSCRVFERRLEDVMLETLRAHAVARGCQSLVATYEPTSKNVILPAILDRLGFVATHGGHYVLGVDAPAGADHHMTILDKRVQHD